MRFPTILIITLLAAILSSCGSQKKLVVATSAGWPPMEMLETGGKLTGFDIELMESVAREAGFKLEMINTDWNTLLDGLDDNKYDAAISSITITEERKTRFDFTDSYASAGQVIISRAGTPLLQSAGELSGKTVGALLNSTGSALLSSHSTAVIKNYDEIGMAVAELSAGKLDAVVADGPLAVNFAWKNPEYKSKIQISTRPLTDEKFAIAVRKGNQPMLDKLNLGLSRTRDNGTLSNLTAKWLR